MWGWTLALQEHPAAMDSSRPSGCTSWPLKIVLAPSPLILPALTAVVLLRASDVAPGLNTQLAPSECSYIFTVLFLHTVNMNLPPVEATDWPWKFTVCLFLQCDCLHSGPPLKHI
jgi:hypothetical protein